MMTKVEAIIQPSKLDAVKEALAELGVDGLTISEVRGHGRQKGHTEMYRGHEYSVDLLPKVKIESVMDNDQVDAVVKAILEPPPPAKSAMEKSSSPKWTKPSASAIRNAA